MTSPSDNDKNKEAASDAKASGSENKADKFASAKETLNKIIYKTGVLAGKAFAAAKAVTKDVVQELRNVNSIRKETVANAAEGTKKTDLAKTFWTKTSGKQRSIVLGICTIFIYVLYSAFSTSGEQYHKEANDFYKNKNYVKALELYKKSADKGYPMAFFDVGWMNTYGEGTPQNYAEAIKWYKKAAEKGNAQGQFMLGTAYRIGNGIEKNEAEGVRWIKKSAAQEHVLAQLSLASLYTLGKGVEQDRLKALMWFNLASSYGNEAAIKGRNALIRTLTQQQIAEAQDLATECKKRNFKNCDSLKTSSSLSTNAKSQTQAPPPVQAQPRDTSYTATFTCGMGPNNHINILACFAGVQGSSPTELELRNGDQYGLYKAHNLSDIGEEGPEGFKIKLKNKFSIKAQNSDRTVVLGLKIIGDQTGSVVYQKQVGQYGVISIAN